MAYSLEDLADVLVGCFEGGSVSWINKVEWSGYKAFQNGEIIKIHTDGMGVHDLDIKKLRKGISKFRKIWTDPNYTGVNYEGDQWYDLNSGVYDANDNDLMLQLALFGEVTYG